MNYTTPEKAGIPSEKIEEYVKILENYNLNTHNIILSRGNNIVFENYWAPFHKDFFHRMYSVSKSFVAIAIGFLEQDGLIDLDDPISKYFPEEAAGQPDENMRNQTIRHMLMMSTAKPDRWWFGAKPEDRVKYYFENDNPQSRPSGTIFEYDSSGSFILCAMVERMTGMLFMDYLRTKLFDKIGVSKDVYCLKCPGGHSWGDSGVLCTPMDLWKVARFMLNRGKWNGEQILNEAYVTAATTKQIDNNVLGVTSHVTWGYGYQFWMTYQKSFYFNGMGCQFAICVPEKDLIFVYNGDNQGNQYAASIIIENFFRVIVDNCEEPEGAVAGEKQEKARRAQERLISYAAGLKLNVARGESYSSLEENIQGVTFNMQDNPMGIRTIKFEFDAQGGMLFYSNAQGQKELRFGRCENVFGDFPEEGYSDETGTVSALGNKYHCAASAAWVEPHKLFIKVQIIDKYFGNMSMVFSFKEDEVGIFMKKNAEAFLDEYQGYAMGRRL